MTKRQIDKIQRQLYAKLGELNGSSGRRSDLITERLNDPMDQIQSRLDLDLTVQAINTDWRTQKAVETAIRLLKTGEYGTCLECGEPINPKRLEAIPWTTLCVRCQETRDTNSLSRNGKGDPEFERAA